MHTSDYNNYPEYRPTILLAQNDERDLNLLIDGSKEYNKYDVVAVSTGSEIIDKVNNQFFDAVVLGLRFPDITGSTLAYLLREFDPLLPLIFLTSYTNSSILTSLSEQLNCKFLDKQQKIKNIPALCEEIYSESFRTVRETKGRNMIRDYVIDRRNRYSKYQKLIVPKGLAEIMDLNNG